MTAFVERTWQITAGAVWSPKLVEGEQKDD